MWVIVIVGSLIMICLGGSLKCCSIDEKCLLWLYFMFLSSCLCMCRNSSLWCCVLKKLIVCSVCDRWLIVISVWLLMVVLIGLCCVFVISVMVWKLSLLL